MSISLNNGAASTGTANGSAPIPQSPQQNNMGFSWTDINSSLGVTRNQTSEALTKTVKALEEVYKNVPLPTGLSVSIVPIDRGVEKSIYLSAVAVCLSASRGQVFYHTMLLEGSNDPLPAKIETINGNQVQIDRLTSDVADGDYARVVHEALLKRFGDVDLIPCSMQRISRSFNLEDKQALHMLAMNALLPNTTELEIRAPGFPDLDITKASRAEKLNVQMTFNQNDKTDYAGEPVRDTISIKIVASQNQTNNQNKINSAERSVNISELGGFIDLVWAPVGQQNNYVPVQGPQPKFAARFVMTSLEAQHRITIPAQLLALSSALVLREGTNWYSYFKPSSTILGKKQKDLRDIGAINYEANVLNENKQYGTIIDTKAASFTDQDLGKLLTSAVRPGLIYSVDVSECGADTWYNEWFLAASVGNPEAQQAIIRGANTLTGGHFAKHFPQSAQPVYVSDDRIHLGYYTNADGQKRDIREIDYLAVMNALGDKDPAAGLDWSQTFLNLNIPIYQRLDARRKMITELVRGGDVTFTGFARRVTFTSEFLNALAMGAREAGLAFIHNNTFGVNYSSQRNEFNMIGGIMAPTQSNMFTSGYQAPVMPSFSGNGHFGRRFV